MKNLRLLSIPLLVVFAVGCTKEADPNAKINEPGYYNGNVKKPGGGPAAGAGEKEKGG